MRNGESARQVVELPTESLLDGSSIDRAELLFEPAARRVTESGVALLVARAICA
mgnify:CR=1 FL=1